jgi:hypothetical protein
MLNDEKRQRFDCLKRFSHLNGREKQDSIVGDNAECQAMSTGRHGRQRPNAWKLPLLSLQVTPHPSRSGW